MCLWLGQFPGQRRSPTLPAHKPLHSLNLVLDWDSSVYEKGRGKLEAYVSNCGYADGLAHARIATTTFCAWAGEVVGLLLRKVNVSSKAGTQQIRAPMSCPLGQFEMTLSAVPARHAHACLRPNVSRPHCTADGTCHHALHRARARRPALHRLTGHLHASRPLLRSRGKGVRWKCKLKASRKRVKQCCKQ